MTEKIQMEPLAEIINRRIAGDKATIVVEILKINKTDAKELKSNEMLEDKEQREMLYRTLGTTGQIRH